jgi:hypothetical protein
MTLTFQDAWTPLGGDLHLRVRLENAPADAQLSVVAHQAVTTRTAFERTAAGGSLGSVLDQVVVPVAALPLGPLGEPALTLGTENSAGSRDPDRLGLRRPGIFPVAVELRDVDDRPLAGFVTYVVAVEAGFGGPVSLPERLGVAWVWPMAAAPSTLTDGTYDPAVVAQLRPDGRLGRQAAALRDAEDVPLTIIPSPETLQAWSTLGHRDASLADGANAVRDALGTDQLVASPYVPIDLPSLLAAGLTGAVDAEIAQGDEALRRLFPVSLDTRTALAPKLDAASLARLQAGGADRLIVAASTLEPVTNSLTPGRPFTIEPPPSFTPIEPVAAVAGDSDLERILAGTEPPALRAQRFLAGLSLVALEQPSLARAVVVVNEIDFDPPAELLHAVIEGLRGHPWLTPMTAERVFDEIPPETTSAGQPVTRSLAPSQPAAPPVDPARYLDTQTRLASFRSLAGPDDPQVERGDRALLLSVSSAWATSGRPAGAQRELDAVNGHISGFLSQIHAPSQATITLTARSGEIPLTFRNDTGRSVSVLLVFRSQKLTFPQGFIRVVNLEPKSTTVRVEVQTRTSGSFPLELSIRSTDGVLTIATTNFSVRSTAVSAAGLALIIGAAAFLALWWGHDIRRRRRLRTHPEPTG